MSGFFVMASDYRKKLVKRSTSSHKNRDRMVFLKLYDHIFVVEVL